MAARPTRLEYRHLRSISAYDARRKEFLVNSRKSQQMFFALVIALTCGCASAPVSAPRQKARLPQRATVDDTCRLARVGGDSKMVATEDGRVVVIGAGLGIMQSMDGGFTFTSIAAKRGLGWPSIAADRRRVWVSWIEKGSVPRVVVAAVGQGLGAPVSVFSSTRMLIDSELVTLGKGRLLLFVTEVNGPANSNEAAYTILCFGSTNGGISWEKRSTAVTGPMTVNIEDSRAIVGADGIVFLAYEWESEERGASKILVQRSGDQGFSWDSPSVLWEEDPGADCEPGGFVRVGRDLWFIASTDVENPGSTYSGAQIAMIRSSDGGKTWTEKRTLIDEPDQISMGGVALQGVVILPSIRHYLGDGERILALYRVDAIGRWPIFCGLPRLFSYGFESGETEAWDKDG